MELEIIFDFYKNSYFKQTHQVNMDVYWIVKFYPVFFHVFSAECFVE